MNTPATIDVSAAAPPRKSRGWRYALGLLLALSVLMLVAGFTLIDHLDAAPMEITVNGAPLVTEIDLAGMPPAHKVVLALGIAVALLVALLVALGGVMVALIALVPIVLFAVVLPLLVGGVVLLLVLSPFVLLAWALWRAMRPAPQRSTTMPA